MIFAQQDANKMNHLNNNQTFDVHARMGLGRDLDLLIPSFGALASRQAGTQARRQACKQAARLASLFISLLNHGQSNGHPWMFSGQCTDYE